MRYILILIFLALGVLNIFMFQDWYQFGIENGISWTNSALTGWGIALLTILITSMLVLKSELKKVVKIISVIIIAGGIFGGTFALNPIYSSDYNKENIALNFDSHSIASQLNDETNSGFEGFVLIARSGCPYCDQAIQDYLVPLKKRNPQMDVAVYQVIGNEQDLDHYKRENTKNILFTTKKIEIPDEQALSINGFPTYVYVKNGSLIHQWSNNDFGFRSLDWIENGLN